MADPDKLPYRVLIAEDHPVFRIGIVESIQARSELELVGEASNGEEAVEAIRALRPDVAVLDMRMPGLDGLAVLQQVADDHLPSRVLFISGYRDPITVHEAIRAGAGGYVSKDLEAEEICDAILRVAMGGTVISDGVQDVLAQAIRGSAPDGLSPRELEVIQLTAEGQSAAEIGEKLFLSPATVKTYLRRIYEKLGVSDRAAAVAEAMRRGLLG